MQVYEVRSLTVHRDMDLIRELLMKLDADPKLDGMRWIKYTPEELGVTDRSAEEVGYHLSLLIEEGFLKGNAGMEVIPPINKLTWKGHEFLSDTRDDTIWSKAKARVKGLADVGVGFMWEIAKAEIKTKLGLP